MAAAPDGLRLRPAGTDDIPTIQMLERHCFGGAWTSEQYARELAAPSSYLVVAEVGGLPVGFAALSVLLDEGHVPSVGVMEGWRRHGIGELLMGELLTEARRRGATTVLLEVRRGNRPARKLYDKLGFEMVGIRRDYYWDPPDDGMVLRLRFES